MAINRMGKVLIDDFEAMPPASPEFGEYWADYKVFQHTHGTKRMHHDAVGTITINYESLIPPTEPAMSLTIYSAATGSPSEEKLKILASWTGDPETTPSERAPREA